MIDDLPFVEARWYTKITAPPRPLELVVLHDAEVPEKGGSAMAIARYLQAVERKASAHIAVDNTNAVRMVLDKDVAYGAAHANRNGLHIEHAGYANQSMTEWLDDYGTAMLVLSAGIVREWCDRYDIPKRYVDTAALLRGDHGITMHRDVEAAWPSTGHTDPGPDFPIDWYLDLVNWQQPPATVSEDDDMAGIIHFPTLRTGAAPTTFDFQYLPANGATEGRARSSVYVTIRQAPNTGQDATIDVYFDGEPHTLVIPGDGRTASIAVSKPGLCSVVGDSVSVQAREFWFAA